MVDTVNQLNIDYSLGSFDKVWLLNRWCYSQHSLRCTEHSTVKPTPTIVPFFRYEYVATYNPCVETHTIVYTPTAYGLAGIYGVYLT